MLSVHLDTRNQTELHLTELQALWKEEMWKDSEEKEVNTISIQKCYSDTQNVYSNFLFYSILCSPLLTSPRRVVQVDSMMLPFQIPPISAHLPPHTHTPPDPDKSSCPPELQAKRANSVRMVTSNAIGLLLSIFAS